jgi:cytosine deaminase
MKEYFLDLVKQKGGFRCEHAHFDKAFLIEKDLLNDAEIPMTKKWSYYRQLKQNYTEEDLYNRMKKCVDLLYKQGVKEATTFVDVDTIVNLKCVDIALKLKENISHYFKLKIAIQPLEGLRSPALKQIYYEAAKKVDVLGALPSRDPDPKKHLEYIFALMKEFNKTLDVHTDQKPVLQRLKAAN